MYDNPLPWVEKAEKLKNDKETSDSQEYGLLQTYIQNTFSDNRQGKSQYSKARRKVSHAKSDTNGLCKLLPLMAMTKHLIKSTLGREGSFWLTFEGTFCHGREDVAAGV